MPRQPRCKVSAIVPVFKFQVDIADRILQEERHVLIGRLIHRLRCVEVKADSHGDRRQYQVHDVSAEAGAAVVGGLFDGVAVSGALCFELLMMDFHVCWVFSLTKWENRDQKICQYALERIFFARPVF